MTVVHMSDIAPIVGAADMVAELRPPQHFATASFASYRPDIGFPSQSVARDRLHTAVERLHDSKSRLGFFRRTKSEDHAPCFYLDGGFGVGKTHLLAAYFWAAPEPRAFGTFIEFTSLVGALGYRDAATALARYRVLCIDEFELDDPGDTLMMTRLLRDLVANGASIVTTSNTPPSALGDGRFAAKDFLREIQSLAAIFDVLRIDGDDYRQRPIGLALPVHDSGELDELALSLAQSGRTVSVDDFGALARHLERVHPVKYGAIARSVDVVIWQQVHEFTSQNEALRMVALVDRLYDESVPILCSGTSADQMFSHEMLAGGYRKKYLRAISRLGDLSARAETVVQSLIVR